MPYAVNCCLFPNIYSERQFNIGRFLLLLLRGRFSSAIQSKWKIASFVEIRATSFVQIPDRQLSFYPTHLCKSTQIKGRVSNVVSSSKVCSELVITFPCLLLMNNRRVRCDDNPLPPEEENWLLCDPDISALHHDSHPLPGVFLAEQRVCPCQDCLR